MNTVATPRTFGTGITFAMSLVAGCLLSTLSVPVNAASIDPAPSLVVKYDAQSLATENGARTLYRRLAAAARQVCPEESGRDLSRLAAARQCQEESIARAVRQIHNPRLVKILVGSANRG
ncbi:MAG: UrcA family protein [Steroidobacteraceae bacterium]|jgi:UrcA family protein